MHFVRGDVFTLLALVTVLGICTRVRYSGHLSIHLVRVHIHRSLVAIHLWCFARPKGGAYLLSFSYVECDDSIMARTSTTHLLVVVIIWVLHGYYICTHVRYSGHLSIHLVRVHIHRSLVAIHLWCFARPKGDAYLLSFFVY